LIYTYATVFIGVLYNPNENPIIYRLNFGFDALEEFEKGGGPLKFDIQTPPDPSSPTLVSAPP
jgi:hypothetical protein